MDYKTRQGLILILLFLCPLVTFSQGIRLGVGYSYLYAKEWDKAIQTYNYSRPFVAQKQPLIQNGANVYSSYLFQSGKRISHGISLSYSYFNSSSANENLANTLSLHFVKPGYNMHFENKGQLKGLSVDVIIAALMGGLFRRVNHTAYMYDDKRAKALGIGGSIDVKCAYHCVTISKRIALSPYIGAGYTPYFYAPKFESLLNQTKQLTSKTSAAILNLELGIILSRK